MKKYISIFAMLFLFVGVANAQNSQKTKHRVEIEVNEWFQLDVGPDVNFGDLTSDLQQAAMNGQEEVTFTDQTSSLTYGTNSDSDVKIVVDRTNDSYDLRLQAAGRNTIGKHPNGSYATFTDEYVENGDKVFGSGIKQSAETVTLVYELTMSPFAAPNTLSGNDILVKYKITAN
jgi:hypothetical protein